MDYKVAFRGDEKQLNRLKRLHPFICGLDTTDLGAILGDKTHSRISRRMGRSGGADV